MQNPMSCDREGVSVFFKDKEGNIFHTYSTYARGIDMMNITYQFLDLVPKGRQDDCGLRHHIQYVQKCKTWRGSTSLFFRLI
jgi:predicted dithiol-disulfide oxidoreductase (DUF899 family)